MAGTNSLLSERGHGGGEGVERTAVKRERGRKESVLRERCMGGKRRREGCNQTNLETRGLLVKKGLMCGVTQRHI